MKHVFGECICMYVGHVSVKVVLIMLINAVKSADNVLFYKLSKISLINLYVYFNGTTKLYVNTYFISLPIIHI